MRVNDLPAIESYVVVGGDGSSSRYRIVYGDSYGEAGGFETWEDAAAVLQEWIETNLYNLARHTVQLHKISRDLKKGK